MSSGTSSTLGSVTQPTATASSRWTNWFQSLYQRPSVLSPSQRHYLTLSSMRPLATFAPHSAGELRAPAIEWTLWLELPPEYDSMHSPVWTEAHIDYRKFPLSLYEFLTVWSNAYPHRTALDLFPHSRVLQVQHTHAVSNRSHLLSDIRKRLRRIPIHNLYDNVHDEEE